MNSNDGRLIKSIWWNTADGDEWLVASESVSLVMSVAFCGDRDEHWILQMVNGIEVARHNARYIASIVWMPNEGGAA